MSMQLSLTNEEVELLLNWIEYKVQPTLFGRKLEVSIIIYRKLMDAGRNKL